ncbi:MAG: bacteriophage abortive infection AbiH family protein [Lachnospiraceae bacterium]|nr:bacteriophage abortive infection AbiH family protein [Lachnospiraceae bacterium]
MNITFLIGNGFDLNLGMKTQYTDFIEYYIQNDDFDFESEFDFFFGDTPIKKFKRDLDKNKMLWSAAELAFGEYTNEFKCNENELKNFLSCHEDFCEKLGEYLDKEQNKVNNLMDDKIIQNNFIDCIRNFYNGFRLGQQEQIKNYIEKIGGGFVYNFVSFNYTTTLDKLYDISKKKEDALGNRVYGNVKYKNKIGEIMHVHGYTDRDMVLGVNDDSQLKNLELFDGYYPEYKAQLIKKETNEMNEQQIDSKVHNLLLISDIIYIYGMSIGETDAIWWQRICEILKKSTSKRIIIHCYDAPTEKLLRTQYRVYEREMKKTFLNYSKMSDEDKQAILPRIHIDSSNIFLKLHNIFNEPIENIIMSQ